MTAGSSTEPPGQQNSASAGTILAMSVTCERICGQGDLPERSVV